MDVYERKYADFHVVELADPESRVMRKLPDGKVNATQLLHLARLDPEKIADKLNEYKNVSDEVSALQSPCNGVYVPLNVAEQLASTFDVLDVVKPLLQFNLNALNDENADASMADASVDSFEGDSANKEKEAETNQTSAETSEEMKVEATSEHGTPSASLDPASASSNTQIASTSQSAKSTPVNTTSNPIEVNKPGHESVEPAEMPSASESVPISAQEPPINAANGASQINSINPPNRGPSNALDGPEDESEEMTIPPLEPHENFALIDVSREVVTELFLSNSRGEVQTLHNILASHDIQEIELDVPIDDAGHTALHWASALAKVSLVADLVQNGANCRRGNRKGESPLVRAVLVTNSSDNQSFSELLDLLFPCLHLGDAQGRTVLHHIALTAGIPGRSDASRYYLDTLVEWAVRRRGASGITWLVNELVDAQDTNGDTALNIAARIGAQNIAQQLVDIGASMHLGNRAGLKPTDFGILPKPASSKPLNENSVFRSLQNAPSERSFHRTSVDGVEKRAEIMQQCDSALARFDTELKHVIQGKDQLLQDAHSMLKSVTEKLDLTVARKESITNSLAKRRVTERQLASLSSAIELESSAFKTGSKESDMPLQTTSFDADQPFRVSGQPKFPTVLLKARISAYTKINNELTFLRDKLRSSSLENEAKFRKVVAQCTSSDEAKVDDILDDLIIAVKRDSKAKIDAH